jgi:hypothetical protein
VDKRDITPVIAQVTRRASGSYDGRRCSICRGIKQSLAFDTYFSLTGNNHIDPNEDVVQQVDVTNESPPTSMMKMMTHHLHQGARKWEKEKETTKNEIQRRKPFPWIASSCL